MAKKGPTRRTGAARKADTAGTGRAARSAKEAKAPSDLAARKCGPCTAGTPPLEGEALARLLGQLGGWSADAGEGGGRRLVKQYRFPDFRQALAFVLRVGEIAEQEGHHPDIELGWGRVKLTIWTHSIGGLSENDFILAAKADRALAG